MASEINPKHCQCFTAESGLTKQCTRDPQAGKKYCWQHIRKCRKEVGAKVAPPPPPPPKPVPRQPKVPVTVPIPSEADDIEKVQNPSTSEDLEWNDLVDLLDEDLKKLKEKT